jgi:hypothetical protein
MLDTQRLFRKSVLNRSLFMGVLISLLISPIALADPPPDPKEQSVPVQLSLIRENLVLMEERLAQQMTDMEGRLDSTMGDIQSSVNVGNGKLDDLQVSADEIFNVVTAVNIELTSTLCFDASGKFEAFVGIHDEVGIGWPNVLSAKAILQGEGALGTELAVANQLCVEVPLYSVESYKQLFTNGGEFDDLIAALALPSQSVVPVLAEVYTELMPTPDEAFLAMANVIDASTGYDIFTGTTGTPNHALLLRPDLLLEPVIPHAAIAFIAEVPAALAEALLNPCKALKDTPIGAALEGREDVEFLCEAQAKSLQVVFSVVNWINNAVKKVLSFFGL